MSRLREILFQRFVSDFNFSKGHPTHFWKSQWESIDIEDESTHEPSKWFILYRGLYCLLFISALIFSTTCQSDLYFIFLTNWSYVIQTIYSILSFYSVIQKWAQRNLTNKQSKSKHLNPEAGVSVELNAVTVEKDGNKTEQVQEKVESVEVEVFKRTPVSITNLHKLIWIMTNIVYVLPYGVAGGYWLVVYSPYTVNTACEKFRSHYIYHGMNSLMALIDTFVSAVHIKLFHCIFPTGLVGVYCFFTFVYEAAGGRYREEKEFIYSVLNWRHCPWKALATSLIAVFLTPGGHFIFCFSLYKFRKWIFSKISK